MSARLKKTEEARIISAIKDAELKCSGEVRVHLEASTKADAMKRAVEVFNELKMWQTRDRNGVLIYISTDDKKFAIIGDEGINAKVGETFWNDAKAAMMSHFQKNELVDGIITGIRMAGEKLQAHFPYKSDDQNELKNDVSYG